MTLIPAINTHALPSLLPHHHCPIADTMSSNGNKRSSSPPTNEDKTPSKRSKTGSSSSGKPSRSSNFVEVEDVALCRAYVNVTLNPIDGVGTKALVISMLQDFASPEWNT
jgi:hypothetical protein